MTTWDSDNPRPVTPLRDLLLAFLGAGIILAIGLTMGVIIGQERGLAACPEVQSVDRFSDFRVAYVSHLNGVQMVQLVGPDSVLVEVEK